MTDGYRIVHLSELEDRDGWLPLREELGVHAFGINAWRPNGERVLIEEHDEDVLGHEELYVVIEGHARFSVGGEEIDATEGTLIHVSDPTARRSARAMEPDTVLLTIGGKPGAAFKVSAWEECWRESTAAAALAAEGRFREAADALRPAVEARPDDAENHYVLARLEAAAGDADAARAELRSAVRLYPPFAQLARKDEILHEVGR